MKRFTISIVCFAAILICLDLLFGSLVRLFEAKADDQNYHCTNYAHEDILILGSSLAQKTIVPTVFEDSLGLSCYNAGIEGNGIIGAWARYCIFCNKHQPQLIIYTLTPVYDYLETDDYLQYLDALKPLYGKDDRINELFESFGDKYDKYLLHSNFIKYNTSYISLILSCFNPTSDLKGYTPLYDVYDPVAKVDTTAKYGVDPKKLAYLDMLFTDVQKRGIKTLIVIPPKYANTFNYSDYKAGLDLIKKYDLPLVNSLDDPQFSTNHQLFYDMYHLNDQGARLYSSHLVSAVKALLNNTQ